MSEARLGAKNHSYGKHPTEETRRKISIGVRKTLAERPEIREMIGSAHRGRVTSAEQRRKASLSMKGKHAGSNNPMYGKVGWQYATYDDFLGHHYRSSWEKDVCYLLACSGIDYEYEGHTFQLIESTYHPDISLAYDCLLEVKGMINEKGVKKLAMFLQMYPDKRIAILTNAGMMPRYGSLLGFSNLTLIEYDYRAIKPRWPERVLEFWEANT